MGIDNLEFHFHPLRFKLSETDNSLEHLAPNYFGNWWANVLIIQNPTKRGFKTPRREILKTWH